MAALGDILMPLRRSLGELYCFYNLIYATNVSLDLTEKCEFH